MINISKAFSAGHGEQYFDEHFELDEYHSQGQKVVGRWVGKGAMDLGLVGNVEREDYSRVLNGLDPRNGQLLVPAASWNHIRRAAWDGVWGAPKSVSIQALIGGDSRLIEAHQRAVERAMREMEACVLTRRHGGKEYIVSGNLVVAAFDHMAARQAEETRLPDPHLHTHCVIVNLTKRPDGAWRGVESRQLYHDQPRGSAIYRTELAKEVEKLGYRIEITAADGRWELTGYTRQQVELFSQRQQQIRKKMDELHVNGSKLAQEVTLSTRQDKKEYDEKQLQADWKVRAAQYGIDPAHHMRQAYARGGISVTNGRLAAEALEHAKAHLTHTAAVIDTRDIETCALQHGMGQIDLDGLRQQMRFQQTEGRLVVADTLRPDRHPLGEFTTPQMLALEAENVTMMRAGQGQAHAIAAANVAREWSQRHGLSNEQAAAAEKMLTSHNWITGVDALAGSGKTYTVGAIRELAEAQGYVVRAFGPTTRSVAELQKAGLSNARTIKDFLIHALPEPGTKELWFVDEHSMLDSLTANRLLKANQQLGQHRIITVGDTGQHQAIGAGNPVKQFMDHQMTVARLEQIRRQEKPELRAAVKAARYTPAQAFDLLAEQGRITEIPDVKERYAAIAAEYLKGRAANGQTLVVSPGNAERKEINETIREALVERGLVQERGRLQEILIDRKLTPAKIKVANSYNPGDLILVHGTREQQKRGLAKNSYAMVEAVNRPGNSLALRTDDGRHIEAYPAQWVKNNEASIEVFTREYRTLAGGDSVQFRRPDKRNHIANGEFATLVELTRDGGRFHFDGEKPRDITLPFSAVRHLDYGYCSTTYSAQGATVEKCIMQLDSMRSERLLNRAGWYVAVSRPKTEVRVFTDDAEALRRAVVRDPQKSIALAAVKQQPVQVIQPQQKIIQRQPRQSAGMRM